MLSQESTYFGQRRGANTQLVVTPEAGRHVYPNTPAAGPCYHALIQSLL